jgi:Membrane transporters of cations and cationic drugs
MHWLLLAIAILFETIATASLKASHGFTRLGPTALSLGAYAVAFWFLAMVLRPCRWVWPMRSGPAPASA